MDKSLDHFFHQSGYSNWIVADKVRVPDISSFLYTYETTAETFTLFEGGSYKHIHEISPIASPVEASFALKERLTKDEVLSSSCIFLQANIQADPYQLVEHLRSLLTVVIDEHPIFYRYYSPAFWDSYGEKISKRDLTSIIHPFKVLGWLSPSGKFRTLEAPKQKSIPKKEISRSPLRLHSPIFRELT
ncbi:DUF4123 domain-containing protein [Grimontia sp. AD028]|uniref:DUF4123 domain-containing protein n=1 Tax=Grimontia sp. AD028 TaxID=1581149 RepID=UPI00061B1436|nr:DUF4123 domain-containing protein [Grimontia sp. AD028]